MSRALISVLLVAASSLPALAWEQVFTLRELVGHDYHDELVHWEIAPPPGQCWPGGVRLRDDAGRIVPVQLAEVSLHPDGSIAQAQVWCVTSLPADATLRYTLTGGARADQALRYRTDLTVIREADTAVLGNDQVAVRVLLGERRFPGPTPAAEVPAPLQALRLRSGAWTGRGWFETKHLCTGYTAELIAEGPVFALAKIRYAFATPPDWGRAEAPFYEMTVQVGAAQEVAYLTESYNLGDPAVYQEPKFRDQKQEMLWDWWSWRPHEAPDNFVFSLYGPFRPTHARTVPHTVSTPDKGKSVNFYGENEYPLQYATDRFEFAINPWGRGEPDQSMYYAAYSPADPTSDIVAILPTMASRWRNPDMLPHEPAFIQQHTDTNDLRVYTSAQPDLFVRAPLSLGRREWALGAFANPGIVAGTAEPTYLSALSRKYGSLPLDKVKAWVLEWPEGVAYPHLFVPPGDLEGLRARIKALPALEQALRQELHIPVHRWLLDGNEADARQAYGDMVQALDRLIADAFSWPYGGEHTGINAFPWWMMTHASHMDVLLGDPQFTAEERRALRARMAFLTYLIWDGEYLPPRKAGFGWGSAGMPTNVGGGRGVLSALLSDHPRAEAWIAECLQYQTYVIENYFGPDGTPFSCPHYSLGTEGGPISDVLMALQGTGKVGDIRERFPTFYRYARFIVDMMPPKDIRFGMRILPTLGDTYWEGNGLSGHIAGMFKDSDPELAAALMSIWLNSGTSLQGFINAAFFLDSTIPAQEPQFKSVAYPGFGAFLRHGVGTEDESYLCARFGDFTIGHMHNEAGGLHWYARGVPLSMDFASMYTPHTASPWWHSTLSYNHQEHATPVPCPGRGDPECFYTGRNWYEHQFEPHVALAPIADEAAASITDLNGVIAAFATQPGADYVRGEANRRWFERHPYFNLGEGEPDPWTAFTVFDKLELANPFRWTRQYAFVKDASPAGPTYLVMADDLTGNRELEPAFNFWCLANDVQDAGDRSYHFTGQHGVDLDMYVLEPKVGRVQLGEWGHRQGFLGGGEENQKLVRVFGSRDGSGFRVVLYPRKPNEPRPEVSVLADGKLVKLVLPDQTHWILLSKDPVTVTDGVVRLSGTAAVAKQWADGRAQVTLLAAGEAACGELTLTSQEPAERQG